MSNFTKSVIYSTAVLAIGLVGILAISGQREGQKPAVAGIEPAAGDSDMGLDFSKTMDEAGENIKAVASQASENAQGAVQAEQSEMEKDLEAVDEEVDDLSKSAGKLDEAAGGMPIPGDDDAASEISAESSTEAAPDAAAIEPAAGEAIEEKANEMKDKVMENVEKVKDSAEDDLGLEE
ncbi:MAG: hypothetical protein H6858_00655 [Rhodospirillales bacterium]|nr:hypothetical protein [Alphaproteobacteria bacterium]MCB1839705.1 hypothetical protein [Alphaproteobacteria bacterium]MCB9976090.1 hypothetical protein [Rhodospirillales bacterium]